MLSRKFALAAMLVLAAAHSALADDKQFIESLYARMSAAIAARNVDAYMAMTDPAAISIDANGVRQDVQGMREAFSRLVSMVRNFRSAVKVGDVRNTGAEVTAVVNTAYVFEALANGRDWKLFVAASVSEDTWSLKGGSWKLTATRVLQSETKEVPPEVVQKLSDYRAAQPQPGAPAQQRPAAPPAQKGSNYAAQKMEYDLCMHHCSNVSSNCSMSTGKYLGGRHRDTGIPCVSSEIICAAGCTAPR